MKKQIYIFILLILTVSNYKSGFSKEKSISDVLTPIYNEFGIDSTLKYYLLLKNEETQVYDFTENQLKNYQKQEALLMHIRQFNWQLK